MRAQYYECTSPAQIHELLLSLAPLTAVIDVEPLIAYWDTDVVALDAGLSAYAATLADVPSLRQVDFATNSLRRPTSLPSVPGVTVSYHPQALKPFRTGRFRALPGPGVVIGDQTATDGLLAYRLGYTFLHYKVARSDMKAGPKLMAALGRPLRPLFRTPSSG